MWLFRKKQAVQRQAPEETAALPAAERIRTPVHNEESLRRLIYELACDMDEAIIWLNEINGGDRWRSQEAESAIRILRRAIYKCRNV